MIKTKKRTILSEVADLIKIGVENGYEFYRFDLSDKKHFFRRSDFTVFVWASTMTVEVRFRDSDGIDKRYFRKKVSYEKLDSIFKSPLPDKDDRVIPCYPFGPT